MDSDVERRRAPLVIGDALRRGSRLLLGLALVASCKLHNRPEAPAVPAGPDSVEVDSAYTFKSWTDGRESEQVYIRFAWGDGDTSSWCGPGDTAECPHSWSKGGVFAVRAQAHDDRTELSEWSAPRSVTVIVPPYPYRIIDSVTIGDAPLNGAQVLPNGEFVYVINEWSASLSVVRTSDLQLVAQIPFYAGWWGGGGRMVCSPDGEDVYAADYRYEYMAVVRTADQVVVDSLMLGDEVTSVAVSPDGQRLFVAVDADSGFIVVVRLPDNVIEDTIFALGGYSYVTSLKVAPDGTRLYAVDLDEGRVCAIRLSDNTIEWQVPAWLSEAPGGIVLHPTGDPLYALKNECVLVLESGTGAVIDSALLSPYWDADIAPDGSFLYVTCSDGHDSGAVAVVRTSDNKVVRVIAMPTDVCDVAPSPDGQRLYVAGDNGKLYVISR